MHPTSQPTEDLALDAFAAAVAARLARLRLNTSGESDPAGWSDDKLAEELMSQTLRGDEIDVAAYCFLLNKRKLSRNVLTKASRRFLRDGLSAYRAIDAAVSDELSLPCGADY